MNAIRAGWIRKSLLAVLSAAGDASEELPRAEIARAVKQAEIKRMELEKEQAGESPESEDDKTHVKPAIPRVQVPTIWMVHVSMFNVQYKPQIVLGLQITEYHVHDSKSDTDVPAKRTWFELSDVVRLVRVLFFAKDRQRKILKHDCSRDVLFALHAG